MDPETREQIVAELTAAVWRAMDAGLVVEQVRDAVDQAIDTHEPN